MFLSSRQPEKTGLESGNMQLEGIVRQIPDGYDHSNFSFFRESQPVPKIPFDCPVKFSRFRSDEFFT